MEQTKVQITDVVYNAGTQCFEALVTVMSDSKTAKYPCAIEAPITISFEQASHGLEKQALRRHKAGKGMHSQMRHHVANTRAGRPSFDPRAWLAQLGFGPLNRAA